ncbi:hypothetical protein EI555_013731, partial [Monodon monoceros]
PALLRNPTFTVTWGEVQSWDYDVRIKTGGLGSRPGVDALRPRSSLRASDGHRGSRWPGVGAGRGFIEDVQRPITREKAHAQATATCRRWPRVASPRFPRPDLTPCPEKDVDVPAPTGHQSLSFQAQQEGTSPNSSAGTLLPLHWGHQEGPQGCGVTARIPVTAARPATLPKEREHKTPFPEGCPFPRGCFRYPDRSGRPVVQVFSLGQHRPCVVRGSQEGTQCTADKTSLEATGSPPLRLPPFWKSPVVNRNPSHDSVRQLAEKTCASDCPYL